MLAKAFQWNKFVAWLANGLPNNFRAEIPPGNYYGTSNRLNSRG